ncbi:MAG: PorT family protein [Flavobacteriales bacterium]|nr:PorT family protein [Flavobacteriales bacterium]MCC6939757.1 PorT family protein [Flavobacteriales bacterium]
MSPKTMNKVFAVLAIALIGTTSLSAQDDASVRFGIKLSPNMGFVKSETKALKANGSGLGYTFGLLAEFPIGANGNYRFATGLNLNNITGKWKEDYTYVDEVAGPMKTKALETDVKLQYVELPLTIKLMTNEIGYMRYYGQVGFGNAFNIRAKADMVAPKVAGSLTDGTPIVTEFTENKGEDIQSDIALYKASLIVGAGMEYNFSGSTSLLVGVTYNNGFTNILNFDVAGSKAKAKAHYFELTVGVFF